MRMQCTFQAVRQEWRMCGNFNPLLTTLWALMSLTIRLLQLSRVRGFFDLPAFMNKYHLNKRFGKHEVQPFHAKFYKLGKFHPNSEGSQIYCSQAWFDFENSGFCSTMTLHSFSLKTEKIFAALLPLRLVRIKLGLCISKSYTPTIKFSFLHFPPNFYRMVVKMQWARTIIFEGRTCQVHWSHFKLRLKAFFLLKRQSTSGISTAVSLL